MSNSKLVNYTKISPNKTKNRTHAIDTITIHVYVGQVTVERMGSGFVNPLRRASCNYGIGTDGKIGLYVDEKDRSWCSSSSSNDNRAITIECASDSKAPYAINDKVYKSLIKLCVDICKRNGIKELKWKADKKLIGKVDKQNMTVHRWFANKACPGDYVYKRLGQIAKDVNESMKPKTTKVESDKVDKITKANVEKVTKVKVVIDDLNIREGPTTKSKSLGYTGKGTFTITEVKSGWGKLKSNAGWIYIDNPKYCHKIV